MAVVGSEDDSWAARKAAADREEARALARRLRADDNRPAWLQGLPDPPREAHPTSPGRDRYAVDFA